MDASPGLKSTIVTTWADLLERGGRKVKTKTPSNRQRKGWSFDIQWDEGSHKCLGIVNMEEEENLLDVFSRVSKSIHNSKKTRLHVLVISDNFDDYSKKLRSTAREQNVNIDTIWECKAPLTGEKTESSSSFPSSMGMQGFR